ncbi:MAG: hypothetical protein ACI86X_000676 [Moritella sp.]|jgi:hypothetical protein
MSWYDVDEWFGDDDGKKKDASGSAKKDGKEETSWYDNLSWDDMGESLVDLFDDYDDKTTNANTRQQPQQTVKDNHGNAVTGTALQPKDNTMLYVGGGVAAVVVLVGLVIALKS